MDYEAYWSGGEGMVFNGMGEGFIAETERMKNLIRSLQDFPVMQFTVHTLPGRAPSAGDKFGLKKDVDYLD